MKENDELFLKKVLNQLVHLNNAAAGELPVSCFELYTNKLNTTNRTFVTK